MKAELFKYYKARTNYHRLDDLKKGAVPNNVEIMVQALYVADDYEKFAGDLIFQTPNNVHWIPERDLEILSEIPREEYLELKRKTA